MFIYASLLGTAFAVFITELSSSDDLLPPPPLNGQVNYTQSGDIIKDTPPPFESEYFREAKKFIKENQ